MRNYLGWVMLGALSLFAACGEGGEAAQADEDADGPVEFRALDGSEMAGNVDVTRVAAGVTRVRAEVRGAAGAGVHQGHIRQGTCDSPGEVYADLLPLATDANGNGSVTTTLQRSSTEIMSGTHVITYNQLGGSPGEPVLCARLPRRQMR